MTTGRYYIRVGNRRRIPVLCDMDTDGGGWTVIHSHGVRHPEEFRKGSENDKRSDRQSVFESVKDATKKLR